MNAKSNNLNQLPNFVKAQLEIINNLQKRVKQVTNDFEIEKNYKNQVYFFILENGYFDEFVKYTEKNPVQY